MRFPSLICQTTTLVALAFLAGAPAAHAQLNFNFTITGDTTQYPVAGTLTGEIFGLTDNTTSSASSVLLLSFPSALNTGVLFPMSAPVDITAFDIQVINSFTVVNGQITTGSFYAGNSNPSQIFAILVGPTNGINNQGNISGNNNGVAGVTFSPADATPEPGSVALLVGMGTMGAGFLARRKKAQKAL